MAKMASLRTPYICIEPVQGDLAEEEVLFTLFNLAQFLGYVEVVRREGPREDAFLQAGNPQGSDTLATLVEGLRFVMSAASGNLVVSYFSAKHSGHPCRGCALCLVSYFRKPCGELLPCNTPLSASNTCTAKAPSQCSSLLARTSS